MESQIFQRLIKESTEECDCPDKYCFLKEILSHLIKEPRTLIQLKCVEKMKYDSSKKQNKDIGWKKAWDEWISCGFAKKFSEVFDENKSIKQIYLESTDQIK